LIRSNGCSTASLLREAYLHFNPAHYAANFNSPRHITEIQFLVEKV
jgi:hypothetical protein